MSSSNTWLSYHCMYISPICYNIDSTLSLDFTGTQQVTTVGTYSRYTMNVNSGIIGDIPLT